MMLTPDAALRKDMTSGYTGLQHRHFATIAAIITKLPKEVRGQVAEHFAKELEYTNPKFNAMRFIAAAD